MLRVRLSSAASALALSLCLLAFTGVQADEESFAQVRNGINKGNQYLSRNLFKQAIEEYEKCLDIDPDNSYAKSNILLAHNNWGIFFFQQGKYELAKEQWQTVLRLSPADRKAKYNLGICQQAMARQGKSAESEIHPANETASVEPKEKPPESAIVILNSGKQTQSLDEKSDSAIKNPDAFVEAPTTAKENASPQPEKTHNEKEHAPETGLGKYYDSGIESGAKILPRKHEESSELPKVDQSIDRLETKIYGQPRGETSVLKRLERMELDSFGKINDAPITERIAKLKRLFSIDD